MTEAEIRQLLDRIGNRDERALALLYREFAGPVARFIAHRVNDANRALVDEMVVDTFFAVWKAPGRFDGSSKFRTWLFSVAYRKMLYALRTERRSALPRRSDLGAVNPGGEPAQVSLAEPADEDADPLQHLLRKEVAEVLVRCADRLSPEQRQCLHLIHIEEMSQSEVALVMGVSVNTVKSRIRLAVHRLVPCVERALGR